MVKIFSNFDSELPEKMLKEAQEDYGKDQVCLVHRDRIYLTMRVYGPLCSFFLVAGFLFWIVYSTTNGGTSGAILWRMYWIAVGGTAIYLSFVLGKKAIDYALDFAVITPKQIAYYNQEGIFHRTARSLDLSKVKSFHIEKKGLLMSIFNYGSIVCFSEGDQKLGDIKLNYITDPIGLKRKIVEITRMVPQENNEE